MTRRVETLRTATRRTAVQPGSSAAPKPTAAGSAITSAALAAVASTTPAPCAALGADCCGCGRPDENALQRRRIEPGTDLREHRGSPAGERSCRARATDRPVPGRPICVPARVGGHQLDAGDRDLGLDVTAEGEAVGGEGGDPGEPLVRPPAGRPERDADVQASGERRPDRGRDRRWQPDDRNVETVVETERSSRDEPVDEDRRGSGQNGIAGLVGGTGRPRKQSGAAGDEAVSAVVEVAREQRPARPGCGVATRPRHAERQRPAWSGCAGERELTIEEDSEAGADDDPDRCGLTAQVCGTDGESGRSSARAADAPVVRDPPGLRSRQGRRRACPGGPRRRRQEPRARRRRTRTAR